MRSISARKRFRRPNGKQLIRVPVICLAILLLTVSSVNLLTITKAAAGDLDATFGNNGKAVFDLFGQIEIATALAIQSDNKIVVAGFSAPLTAPATRSDFALT